MSRPLRVAYGRIFHEANAYSPLPSSMENFRRMQYVLGDEVSGLVQPLRWELPGLIPLAELSGFAHAARRAGGVELVPLLSAFAVPSGKLVRRTAGPTREPRRARLAN